MSLNTAKIDDFSGGLNLIDPDEEMDSSEFPWGTKNIECVGKGMGFRARRPIEADLSGLTGAAIPAHSTTQVDFTSCTGFRLTANDPDKLMISNDNGKVLTVDFSTSPQTVTQIIAGSGGPTKEWCFQQASDNANTQKVYMCNGSDTPQAYSIAAGTIANWAGAPPNGEICRSWKTMMVVAGVAAQPQRLYYSQPNNPELWTAPGGFIDIKTTDDDADGILGLEIVGENLLVFKRNSVWLVFDPVSFDNRRIADVGVFNLKSTATVRDRAFFVGPAGVFSTDGDELRDESENLKPIFDGLAFGIQPFLVGSHDNKIYMKIGTSGDEDGAINYAGLYQMELTLMRPDKQHPWFFHGATSVIANVTCMTRAMMTPATGPVATMLPVLAGMITRADNAQLPALFFWVKGFAHNFDLLGVSGVTPQWVNLDAKYISRWFPIQGDENRERIRRVNIIGRGETTVNWYADFSGAASFTQALTDKAARFNRVRPEVRGRFHRISLNYSEATVNDQRWIVDAIEVKYRGGKEH